MTETKQLEVYLRSGVVLHADVEDVEVGRGAVTAELRNMRWSTPSTARRQLLHIDLTEIDAIVVVTPTEMATAPDGDEGGTTSADDPSR